MVGEVTVSLKAGKGKFSWYLPPPDPAYTIAIEPSTGSFKKVGSYCDTQ